MTNEIIKRLWSYILKVSDPNEFYRTIGISFTNFKSNQIIQLELFKSEKEVKNEIIDHTLDSLRLKYGQNIVMRATNILHNVSLSQPDLLAGHKA